MTHDSPAIQKFNAEKASRVEEIGRSLGILHHGRIFEVRGLDIPGRGKPHQASGYFNNVQEAADAVFLLGQNKPGGIYTVLNACDPALFGRSPNKLSHYPANTTADREVIRRHFLFIDCDSSNPTGVAATNEECQCAMDLAYDAEQFLRGYGFGEPLVGSSGNGTVMLYRVDLPNDEASNVLLRNVLLALAAKAEPAWHDPAKPHSKIDTVVHNAARLIRIAGTYNRKGHPTPDRPHRMCEWGDVPEVWEAVSIEKLEAVAALAPKAQPAQHSKANGNKSRSISYSQLLVDRYLSDYGIKFTMKVKANGTYYVLEECPFDPQHGSNGEVAIVQNNNGLVTYNCKHTHCDDRKFRDFRDEVGTPDPERHYDPPLSSNGKAKQQSQQPATCQQSTSPGNGQQQTEQQAAQQSAGDQTNDSEEESPPEPPEFVTSLLNSADFDAAAYKQEFLVRDVLAAGQQCVIGGRSKTLKTSLAVDLVVSLGSGTPFLGYERFETKKCRVAFWSGESGAPTIQATARRCPKPNSGGPHSPIASGVSNWSPGRQGGISKAAESAPH